MLVTTKAECVCVCVLQQCYTHTLTQLTDEESSERGLLMVVLDVHVDDVHRLERLLFTGVQVCRKHTHLFYLWNFSQIQARFDYIAVNTD